ncbi:MAG: GatB/YqeY domain-containing protein [Kurthia sp.]|nr:GatB/YqeY domain-containing protein [Candidatus Kurthia equi]
MLKEQIFEDLKTAMRAKDSLSKGVLSILKSNMDLLDIELKRPSTEDEKLAVVKRELKQTEQALAGAKDAKREDLIEKEQQKIDLIKHYLPRQLNYEEIIETLSSKITTEMNIGEAMKIARPILASSADGALISKAVKELIQGGN